MKRQMLLSAPLRKVALACCSLVLDVQVFDHVIDTIVLADDAATSRAALSRVSQARRPKMASEIFQVYARY